MHQGFCLVAEMDRRLQGRRLAERLSDEVLTGRALARRHFGRATKR